MKYAFFLNWGLCWLVLCCSVRAELVLDFSIDTNPLDGTGASGPNNMAVFSDGGRSATITTTGIAPDGLLNLTDAGDRLGINNAASGDDATDEFDPGEVWTFNWSEDVTLTFIDIDALSGGESMFIASSAWLNQSIDDSNSAAVTFNGNDAGRGVFTLVKQFHRPVLYCRVK